LNDRTAAVIVRVAGMRFVDTKEGGIPEKENESASQDLGFENASPTLNAGMESARQADPRQHFRLWCKSDATHLEGETF